MKRGYAKCTTKAKKTVRFEGIGGKINIVPQILGGWIERDRTETGRKVIYFFAWFVFSGNGIENDFLRRWIWKIGRLQDLKTVENVAKLKKGRLTELGKCDCGQD